MIPVNLTHGLAGDKQHHVVVGTKNPRLEKPGGRGSKETKTVAIDGIDTLSYSARFAQSEYSFLKLQRSKTRGEERETIRGV